MWELLRNPDGCKRRGHAPEIILQQEFHHVLKEKRPVQGCKVSFLPLTGHTLLPAPHKSAVKMPILFSVPKSKIWRVDLVEKVSRVNRFPSSSHRRAQENPVFTTNSSFSPKSSAPYLQVPKFRSQTDLHLCLEAGGDRCYSKLQRNSKTQEMLPSSSMSHRRRMEPSVR